MQPLDWAHVMSFSDDSEPLSGEAVRDKLIAAAANGPSPELTALCRQHKDRVAEHIELMTRAPEGMPTDDATIERYVQCLGAVAQCLANECGAPELWNKLCGNADNNPMIQWRQWFESMPQRMAQLEYDELIGEAISFIEEVRGLQGTGARQQEAFLVGRLGELLFHSGRVAESLEPFQDALDTCAAINDMEGQIAYCSNQLEAHCYLDDGQAVATAERLLALQQAANIPSDALQRRIARLRDGEPLCRVVCVRDDQAELELDELTSIGEGHFQFHFRRNRLPLQKTAALTRQGNELASSGQYAEALERYHAASEVDPYDPDPVYQSGMCLLEMGAHGKAREAFEQVERLAPGWYRCRTDRWLAAGLENGTISNEEFMLIRVLDDGGLEPPQASEIAEKAVARFPEFAPLYLFQGDLRAADDRKADAIAAYRRGLELAAEPDLESRLLCALAGRLAADDPERQELIDRAVQLDGSLVALAAARLIRREA